MMTTQNSTVPLTYEGPAEVLVKTPVTFQGHYDRATIHHLSLRAEDQWAFPVILDPHTSQWHSNLDEGFYTTGTRWLRLQGTDATGCIVGEQVIQLLVSTEPLSVGQAIELEIRADTFCKSLPLDSALLRESQLMTLKAGQRFSLDRYGYTQGYLYVELSQDLAHLGRIGYVDASQVRLHKGREQVGITSDEPPVLIPGPVQVQVLQETWLKTHPLDSASLSPVQRQRLQQGQQFTALSYGYQRGHVQVVPNLASLPNLAITAQPVPSPPTNHPPHTNHPTIAPVYVPWSHVSLSKAGHAIPVDDQGLTLAITQDTVLKKQPTSPSSLDESESCPLPRGSVYGLVSYRPTQHHVHVTLAEPIPGFGHTGYCGRQQVNVRRGNTRVDLDTVQVELNVPYLGFPYPVSPPLSPAADRAAPAPVPLPPALSSTLTAIAMALTYHGLTPQSPNQSLHEELSQHYTQRYGSQSYLDSSRVVRLVQSYGFEVSFSTQRTWAEVRQRISHGQPVIVESYCTHQNHSICIIGFTTSGYLVNDPWGNALRGYHDRQGAKLCYPQTYLQHMCRLGQDSLGDSEIENLGAYFLAPNRSHR
ncbi:MAG: C39 family peptidase [Prochlorothrix sp.]|nr:C39 family peptidase [Prochlorothrix sp.]